MVDLSGELEPDAQSKLALQDVKRSRVKIAKFVDAGALDRFQLAGSGVRRAMCRLTRFGP